MSKTLNILMLMVFSCLGLSILASTESKKFNSKIIKCSNNQYTNHLYECPPTPPYGATGV